MSEKKIHQLQDIKDLGENNIELKDVIIRDAGYIGGDVADWEGIKESLKDNLKDFQELHKITKPEMADYELTMIRNVLSGAAQKSLKGVAGVVKLTVFKHNGSGFIVHMFGLANYSVNDLGKRDLTMRRLKALCIMRLNEIIAGTKENDTTLLTALARSNINDQSLTSISTDLQKAMAIMNASTTELGRFDPNFDLDIFCAVTLNRMDKASDEQKGILEEIMEKVINYCGNKNKTKVDETRVSRFRNIVGTNDGKRTTKNLMDKYGIKESLVRSYRRKRN